MIGASKGDWRRQFLAGDASIDAYERWMARAGAEVGAALRAARGPCSGASVAELFGLVTRYELPVGRGLGMETALRDLREAVLPHLPHVAHPRSVAHLQCPPLIPSLVAEAVISATNASMDSWDQSFVATTIETRMVEWLRDLVGFPTAGDGVFTAGGTQSNLMGLLLARERFAAGHDGRSVRLDGFPPEGRAWRVLCSDRAHFSVRKAAALLGLGERSVVAVPTDDRGRMDPDALDACFASIDAAGASVIAVVATAGTTDHGAVDPLDAVADRTQARGTWLHVDASYGGALLTSAALRARLAGIERADSVAIDLHKLFFQPVSCGAFVLRDRSHLDRISGHVDYLNPESDDVEGVPNLVSRSLATTRRFDALKLFVSLRALGVEAFGEMIERLVDLAAAAAASVRERDVLELLAEPELTTVLFRYRGSLARRGGASPDDLNAAIRDVLMRSGRGLVARTSIDGRLCLKLTLMNPCTSKSELDALLDEVVALGRALETARPSAVEVAP